MNRIDKGIDENILNFMNSPDIFNDSREIPEYMLYYT